MAWCRQATSHYLSQCWPRFLSPYVSLGHSELINILSFHLISSLIFHFICSVCFVLSCLVFDLIWSDLISSSHLISPHLISSYLFSRHRQLHGQNQYAEWREPHSYGWNICLHCKPRRSLHRWHDRAECDLSPGLCPQMYGAWDL